MRELTPEERIRYKRHLMLEDIGEQGQAKLLESRVLVVGAGGLGSPALLYLAAAGVGTIGIVDFDAADLSNLQRQICHTAADVGRPKVTSAAEKLRAINPDINVVEHRVMLDADNAPEIMAQYDFVIEATDNFETKFLVNDTCVALGKAFSHGGIRRYDGETLTYAPGHACYRCVFGAPPPEGSSPKSSDVGVLGAIAGMLGTIQAAEAIKYITGVGKLLTDRLLTFDAREMTFNTLRIGPQAHCPACAQKRETGQER